MVEAVEVVPAEISSELLDTNDKTKLDSNSGIICVNCKSEESFYWTRRSDNLLCIDCIKSESLPTPLNQKKCSNSSDSEENNDNDECDRLPRVQKKLISNGRVGTRNRGRRVFKKNQTLKAPRAVSVIVPDNKVLFRRAVLQIGDVVSLYGDDNRPYYAQIRAFLKDQYNDLSAVITWLLPSLAASSDGKFDPTGYIVGPDEDLPRRLETMEFVCHAPSAYFHYTGGIMASSIDVKSEVGFVWNRQGPLMVDLSEQLPSDDELSDEDVGDAENNDAN